MSAINIKNLTKSYGEHRGIENVSFSVEEGEIFGFIGPNGAGKSTTIRTLLALIHPTSGSAEIFGKDCIRQAPEIAKDVGYLPGESAYYDNMTVRELVRYAADLYGVKCDDKIKELSKRLNLDLSRKIADLSLGNKKKIGIVCALLHSPKLIILDEPTSGLDPLIQQEFFNILKEENKRGATIFFSSHVLSEVQKICDRVAILKEGKMIGVQKISELRANSHKKISVTATEIPAGYFNLDGISNYQQDGSTATFMFMGNIADVLAKLSVLNVRDLFIEEPALEEIFMHYYR
ncbi:ABC transporter ATP-binding protein [Clostridium sp. Marseille-P2415]|uniref:ABC transporter ATP-binding protein n=1 Tax=Clostridium sp. Marseille-P2415 TaxID=1805471 RepID=UPI0009885D75|nr:ABC transporter ATP-binding protein [Clostridium sp. Marseille-P2415]